MQYFFLCIQSYVEFCKLLLLGILQAFAAGSMRVASYTLHSPSPLFATVDNNSIQGLVIKADKLAEELANRRRYITIDTTRNIMSFDPRFLVFEFTYNLILRESQVFLLIKCMKHLVMIWRCARVFM